MSSWGLPPSEGARDERFEGVGALFRPSWDSGWSGRTREIRRWQVLLVALAMFLVGMLVGSSKAGDDGTGAIIVEAGNGGTTDGSTPDAGSTASTTTTTTPVSSATRAVGEVKFLVLNGAKIPGGARDLTNDLIGRGYAPEAAGDTELHPQNTVYFHPTSEPDCNALASIVAEFTGARTATVPLFDPVQIPAAAGLDCLVVLGRDFAVTVSAAPA